MCIEVVELDSLAGDDYEEICEDLSSAFTWGDTDYALVSVPNLRRQLGSSPAHQRLRETLADLSPEVYVNL